MIRLEHEPAFVLHSRHCGETSLIVDLFTREQGRLSVYARGARKRKKSAAAQNLSPFIPLVASAQGKGNLKSLTSVEAVAPPIRLAGKFLYCGFYMNELLVRLLPEQESQPELFQFYLQLLARFSAAEGEDVAVVEPYLRQFEWQLIQLAGVSFDLVSEADTGVSISEDSRYEYRAGLGMVAATKEAKTISGAALIALSEGSLDLPEHRAEIKRLMRVLLKPLLGTKPLASRELFVQ